MKLHARFAAMMLSPALLAAGPEIVSAQNYPHKPIRIVTTAVGGSTDLVARTIAQGLTGNLGQQVIVENRGGGVIAGEIVSKASPDGYTLLYFGNSLWITPLLRKNMPYDVVGDFAPITLAISLSQILVLHPSVAAKSVKELIAVAKAKPGALNYASGPGAGTNVLAAELFKAMAGIDIVRIPFKGEGPAVTALLGGDVQMQFASAGSVAPHLKFGRLRALAVTSAKPSVLFPDMPTMSASLPGYEATQTSGMFAPAKTPLAVIRRLNQESVRVLNEPEVKQKILGWGAEPVANSPEELAAIIRSDRAKFSKLFRDAGIREE